MITARSGGVSAHPSRSRELRRMPPLSDSAPCAVAGSVHRAAGARPRRATAPRSGKAAWRRDGDHARGGALLDFHDPEGSMFTKLLVPLDRSSLAEQAVGHASSIARACHAGVDVVPVSYTHLTLPTNREV